MSKESFQQLKACGYDIEYKMGKTKFIPVFPPYSKASKARHKRSRLITEIISDCLADRKISERIRRCEDLQTLTMKIQNIFKYPEYSHISDQNELRSEISQFLEDPEHRERVENIIRTNAKPNHPKFRPICKESRTRPPRVVLKTIFNNYSSVWNFRKNRYNTNAAACKFHGAMKDLMSKDWLHNYCLLAGYVPIMKKRTLGELGLKLQMSCECRKFDKYRYKKNVMKKLFRENRNYRYHILKKVLFRQPTSNQLGLHTPPEHYYLVGRKTTMSGVWTRVFKGTFAQSTKSETSFTRVPDSTEKEMWNEELKDISSPQFNMADKEVVAIKVFAISPHLPGKLIPSRILTILELGSILNHPNIVRFTETYASKQEIFMVMRFAENRSLHHIINTHGRLLIPTAQVWAFQMALALQYLHTAGIIHRNVKCSNILINSNYDAILSGFGSAKVKWLDQLHLEETVSVNYHVGYPPYRAPEILRRKPYFMPPIDVWSLGVVLFRMLNNGYPFCYHDKKAMLRQQKLKKWNGAWRRNTVPRNCLQLLEGMLEPNQAKRLRINQVVNHRWFKKWPIPKIHEEALQNAPFLFVPFENADDNVDGDKPLTIIHKNYRDTLDEISNTLAAIVNRKRKTPRTLQPLEEMPAYRECYPKNMKAINLLGKIDASFRRKRKRVKKEKSETEYDKYISEKEELEIHERTAANIEEMKEEPELFQNLLEPLYQEDKNKKSLMDMVAEIKEKSLKFKVQQDELNRKLAIFMPKAVESEPRSILQIKPFSRPDRKAGELTSIMPSKPSISMSDFKGKRNIGLKTSNDNFLRRDYESIISLSNFFRHEKIDTPLPKLEFVRMDSNRESTSTSIVVNVDPPTKKT